MVKNIFLMRSSYIWKNIIIVIDQLKNGFNSNELGIQDNLIFGIQICSVLSELS